MANDDDKARILLVEPLDTLAGRVEEALRASGLTAECARVESAAALRDALRGSRWDALLVADASLADALAVASAHAPGLPCIAIARAGPAAPTAPDWSGTIAFVGHDDLTPLRTAIDRALAHPRSERTTVRLPASRIASQQLLAAQDAERRRISRALHDEIGTMLTALKLAIEAARRGSAAEREQALDEALGLVRQTIVHARDFSAELWPAVLEELGLAPALRWLAERHMRWSGVSITVDIDAPARPPAPLEATAFRIVQEALSNAVRHADATTIAIVMRTLPGGVELVVRDDGRGFDPVEASERAAAGASVGLVGMRERAALAGGRLEVHTSPGRGTTIRIRLPVRSAS